MKNETETRANLLKSAKQEFLEKGFLQASLRTICKNAGVTTGALYFFFKDKEDLFAALVEEPLTRLFGVMQGHYEEEMQRQAMQLNGWDDFEDDVKVAKQVIHFMYQYYEEFQLLLVKSKGSRFEACIDQFVEITQQHYRVMADILADGRGAARLDEAVIHWMSHMHIDIFVHMLTHEVSEEEALKHIEVIMRYLISGWFGMFDDK